MTGETDSALMAEARRLEAAGKSQRQIAAALNRPRHWVRYSLARGNEKTIVDVTLRSLKASPHARAVDPVHVDALAKSIAEIGLIEPILIRPLLASAAAGEDGATFEVMAGLHRVQACIKLGRDTVPAVIREADDLTAELVLIDENLCRRDLSTAERARAVLRRKVLYEHLHPETKPTSQGGEGRRKATRRQAGDESVPSRFTQATAETTGISERTIQRDAMRGERLGETALQKIVHTSLDSGEEIDALAQLSPQRRDALIERAAAGEAVTAKPEVKRERREVRERELGDKIAAGNLGLPQQKFGVILADPAWGGTVYGEATGMDRHAANHYPTATGDRATQDDAIKALAVASLAADDCVLGLWCTDPDRGIDVLRAWRFAYCTYFIWTKDIVEVGSDRNARAMFLAGDRFEVVGAAGLGYIRRDRSELLLIGSRGKPVWPAPGTQGESVWFARRGEHATSRDEAHSDKPECSFEWFERHWPTTPKIELNARRARPGWSCWGFGAPAASQDEAA
jgi:N6-adenosine-specific RNA methylase IME4